MSRISPCLWFDSQAEEAANFYVSIFPNSHVGRISRYGTEGQEFHGKEPGSVMVVEFELDGNAYTALNGGPHFTFDEAISFQIFCDSQDEIDHYWSKLSEGGSEAPCGWLKDKFGLSWQVVPRQLAELMSDTDPERVARVMNAMFSMTKFDLDALRRAKDG